MSIPKINELSQKPSPSFQKASTSEKVTVINDVIRPILNPTFDRKQDNVTIEINSSKPIKGIDRLINKEFHCIPLYDQIF